MKHLALGFVAALSVVSSASAQVTSGLKATAVSADSFAVTGYAELWARDYWCAAGSFAAKDLGLGTSDRLYVRDPYSRGKGVVFTTSPLEDGRQSNVIILGETIRTAGASLSVAQAQIYCADRKLRRS